MTKNNMIPNAVVSTGAYAGLWSHLKSIDHAIQRVLNATTNDDLTELDNERLRALVELLQGELPSTTNAARGVDLTLYFLSPEPNYNLALKLREKIDSIEEFNKWKKLSKMGYEAKLQRLTDAVSSYASSPRDSLFIGNAPVEELKVLQAIVQSLLSDAEADMH